MIRLALCLVVMTSSIATAQPDAKPVAKPPVPGKPKEQIINVKDPLSARGKVRGPNVLYFLERASEELERASLEQRSFLRELTRSIDVEAL